MARRGLILASVISIPQVDTPSSVSQMEHISSVVLITVNEPEKLLKEDEGSSEASENEYPDGGRDAWLAVLGSFLIFFAPLGLMNSFGTFQVRFLFPPSPEGDILTNALLGVLLFRLPF